MRNTNFQFVDAERNDVSAQYPDVLKAIMANFTLWHESIMHSIDAESKCNAHVPGFKTRSFYDEGEFLSEFPIRCIGLTRRCNRPMLVASQHARKDRSQAASRAVDSDRCVLETSAAYRY